MKWFWLFILVVYWVAMFCNSYPKVLAFFHNWENKKHFQQNFNAGKLDDAERLIEQDLESLGFRLLVSVMITVMTISLIFLSDAPQP